MATVRRIIEVAANANPDANGVANLIINGPSFGHIDLDSIVVTVIGSSTVPDCTVYDGVTVNPGRVRASTRLGDKNTFSSQGDQLYPGQQLFVQWTKVAPGATCFAILHGIQG